MEQNFNLIIQTSFENDAFLDFQRYYNELISKKSEKIFKSLDYTSIPEKLLSLEIWESFLAKKYLIIQLSGRDFFF